MSKLLPLIAWMKIRRFNKIQAGKNSELIFKEINVYSYSEVKACFAWLDYLMGQFQSSNNC